jgi:hypothetical protein
VPTAHRESPVWVLRVPSSASSSCERRRRKEVAERRICWVTWSAQRRLGRPPPKLRMSRHSFLITTTAKHIQFRLCYAARSRWMHLQLHILTHEVFSAHPVVGPELILHLPRKLRDALTKSLLTLPLQLVLLPSRALLPSSFLPSYITPTLYSTTDPPPTTRFYYRFPCYPTLSQPP